MRLRGNMLPVKPLPQSIRLRSLWVVPKRLCSALLLLMSLVPRSVAQSVPPPPQGTQTDAAFADSFRLNHVSSVFATTQKTSCYTPEVPFAANLGRRTAIPVRSDVTAARIQAKISDLIPRKTS